MKSTLNKLRVIATCAALSAATFAGVAAAPEATAAPAKIPDNPAVTFTIMGGNIAFGTSPTGKVSQSLGHPDQPAQCQDGVDNESGAYHNGMLQNAPFTPNPSVPATDGLIDFGAGATNETANTGCINGADNLELFDRTSMIPDPAPLCGSGAASEGFTVKTPPGCTSAVGDSLSINAGLTLQKASVTFGNGNATTGQVRAPSKAGPGTVVGTNITVPQANISFSRGYQAQSSCQNTAAGNLCLDFYVEFSVLPQSNITGTTLADGSGTVLGGIKIGLKLTSTYDTGQVAFFGTPTPMAADCSSSAIINLNMTTGNSGSQTGVLYDDVRQNFKVVQDAINFPNFTGTNFGGTLADFCAQISTTLGLPDAPRTIAANTTSGSATVTSAALFVAGDVGKPIFGVGIPQGATITAFATTSSVTISAPATATGATNVTIGGGKIGLIMTPQATSNSAGSSAAGTGMAATADLWRPASVTQVGVNGGALGAVQFANNTVNVNEGDVVSISGAQSYDPAMRALTTNTLTRTGGTAAPPPATVSAAANDVRFVAQDAPAAGATHIYSQTTSALLGPGNQTQTGLVDQTINVQNVAPVANAGPAFLANGGQPFTLKGSSTDPGDPDTVAGRGYCWTRVGGGIGPVPPVCSGSPIGNGKNLTLMAPNANGTETYSLVVTDKDGAASAPSTVVVTFRATVAGTISGVANLDGVPAAGITVDLFRASTGFIATTTSAAGGTYSFAGLPLFNDYLVLFSKAGATSEYYNRATTSGTATRIDITTGGKSIIDGFLVTLANAGTIATNVKDIAGNVVGTSVRIYDETGFVRAGVTDAAGNATFAGLPPKTTYRVRVGLGDATHAELWAVTGGNTVGTAGTGGWTGSQAAKFTVTSATTTNVNAYLFTNGVAANALGDATGTTTGAAAAPVNDLEVRLYDATTGAFVSRATTGRAVAGRNIVAGVAGTFSFNPNQTLYGSGTVLDPTEPNNMLGVRPGNYKVWFRNPSGVLSGGNPVCSTWANGSVSAFLLGNSLQGSGKLALPLNIASGATLAFGAVNLTSAPGCS